VDSYDIVKFFHVLFAVAWIGGGLALIVISNRAGRSTDPADIVKVGRDAAWLGERYFIPVSLMTLIFGIITVLVGDWGFTDTWVLLGLIGYGLSFLIGAGFLGPQSGKIATLAEEHGDAHPLTVKQVKKVLVVSRIDSLLVVLVVFDMIIKPGA
jgi:uncharacterized membrane protein